jgi:hypothetical protein
VPECVYKIIKLLYDESSREARITIGIYSSIAASKIHNGPTLDIWYYRLPEWDKSTPGNTLDVAYTWLTTQPELASALSDTDWLAQQQQAAEEEEQLLADELPSEEPPPDEGLN